MCNQKVEVSYKYRIYIKRFLFWDVCQGRTRALLRPVPLRQRVSSQSKEPAWRRDCLWCDFINKNVTVRVAIFYARRKINDVIGSLLNIREEGSNIGSMKTRVFSTNTQSRVVSVVLDGVMGPLRQALQTWLLVYVLCSLNVYKLLKEIKWNVCI